MAMKWVKDRLLPGFDPASAWSIGHGRDFVPVLRERKSAADDFDFVVSTQGPGYGAATLLSATAKTKKVADGTRLHRLPLRRKMLGAAAVGKPLPVISKAKSVTGYAKAPPKALVGVIDHAINVAHARFRRADGRSRVACAWLQGGTHKPGVPFGCEWSGADLTALIKAHGASDEALLRVMGGLDFANPGDRPLAHRQSHGTHVLDLAAGADPGDAAAQSSDILAVMLPPVVARESSGEILPFFFLQGFAYLLQRARELNAGWKRTGKTAVPLYVNASLGISGGPRGGEGPIEAGIAALIEAHADLGGCPVTVIFPAGNRNLARGHAQGTGSLDVPWRLQPGDRTSNHVDCHMVGPGDAKVALCAPGGGWVEVALRPGDAYRLEENGAVIGRVVLEDAPGGRRLGVSLAPTDPSDIPRAPARGGAWGLRVTAPKRTTRIDAWILRDDSPPGFSDGGRQSYFDDPDYEEHLRDGDVRANDPVPLKGYVARSGALNAMATAPDRIVVGGYSLGETAARKRVHMSLYSAAPLAGDVKEAVSVSAVSDRSRNLGGVLGAGTLSGSALSMNGTSVAAPQATRVLADGAVMPDKAKAELTRARAFKSVRDVDAHRAGTGGLPLNARLAQG